MALQIRAIPTCVGTTGASGVCAMTLRAIPTCVGTTGGGGAVPRPGEGHPHMRGDYT